MSVTQAALAVVGAVIGSSFISILVFYLIIRYRRRKRAARDSDSLRGDISYPKADSLTTSNANASIYFPPDVKIQPAPRFGYATSVYDNEPAPAPASTGVGTGTGMSGRQPGFSASPYVVGNLQRSASYSAFPRSRDGGALEKVDEEEVGRVSGELKTWLRSTTTVSPFGSMENTDGAKGSNWPFDKDGARRTMTT